MTYDHDEMTEQLTTICIPSVEQYLIEMIEAPVDYPYVSHYSIMLLMTSHLFELI